MVATSALVDDAGQRLVGDGQPGRPVRGGLESVQELMPGGDAGWDGFASRRGRQLAGQGTGGGARRRPQAIPGRRRRYQKHSGGAHRGRQPPPGQPGRDLARGSGIDDRKQVGDQGRGHPGGGVAARYRAAEEDRKPCRNGDERGQPRSAADQGADSQRDTADHRQAEVGDSLVAPASAERCHHQRGERTERRVQSHLRIANDLKAERQQARRYYRHPQRPGRR